MSAEWMAKIRKMRRGSKGKNETIKSGAVTVKRKKLNKFLTN